MATALSNLVSSDSRVTAAGALQVEVVADLICPFCYLGKRRLDTALRAVKGPSEVSWYPYQLNPDMPEEGMSFDEYLTRRFGNPANIEPVLQRLSTEGSLEGIAFRFDKLKHMPNTLPAHQLMRLAETEGKDQSALAETLMAAFFERGEDIGDADVLAAAAARFGIEGTAVSRALSDEQTRRVVLSREAQVRSSGMGGVPGFLLNRRLLVVGAQSTETLITAFDRAMFGEGDDEFGSPAVH